MTGYVDYKMQCVKSRDKTKITQKEVFEKHFEKSAFKQGGCNVV